MDGDRHKMETVEGLRQMLRDMEKLVERQNEELIKKVLLY